MRIMQLVLSPMMLALALLCSPGTSAAQSLPTPTCAWQYAWTPSGLGNWLFPDTANRWPYMPIDKSWQTVTITGAYPKVRFFSFAVYDDAPVSTGLADHLYDAQITPDPGSVNPFEPTGSGTSSGQPPQNYTITITRSDSQVRNALRLHADTGWLVYRLYLPNTDAGSTGGVPLPSIRVTDAQGRTTFLPACQNVNRQSELAVLEPQIVPDALESSLPLPPVPDRVWFAPIPKPPPQLVPNPDQKYMVSFFMSPYEPGRIIVIRGKMPAFPDTFNGEPVWVPAPGFSAVQLRYFSMCVGDLVSPLPIEGCALDATTPLDQNGYYTIVISNDVLRPDWVPSGVVWVRWGDENLVPKTILLRSLLPSLNFSQTVQEAIAEGCGVTFNFPTPPTQDQITRAGECTENVMGNYYPVAMWCDRSAFEQGGWQACIKEQ